MSKAANTDEPRRFSKVRKCATRISDPKSIESLVWRHKNGTICHVKNKIFENQFWFYHKAWLPSLAFSFLPGILLALCHCSGAALMDRAIEIKGLSGWKSKVNKTAWWQGCRWLLQVFQQNEQQFILEQPIGFWLD